MICPECNSDKVVYYANGWHQCYRCGYRWNEFEEYEWRRRSRKKWK